LFDKIVRSAKLSAEESYLIPDEATYIGIKTGRIAFFKCVHNPGPNQLKSRNNWRFFKVPSDAGKVIFPEFRGKSSSGWTYGEPFFL